MTEVDEPVDEGVVDRSIGEVEIDGVEVGVARY